METQDGNHHLEKQKKLDNRARKVNKAGQLKKTLENTWLCGSPAVNCSCLIICICICIWMYLKLFICQQAGQVVGCHSSWRKMRGTFLKRAPSSFETLSLAATSVCRLVITVRTAWVANTHIRKYVHIGRSRSGPPTYTTSAAIWNPCVGGKYIDPECIIHPTEVNI